MATTSSIEARTLENYVDGEWRESTASEWIEDRNPSSGEVVARIPLSEADDVEAAVVAALRGAAEWRDVPVTSRARSVLALRDTLVDHREEIAALVTQDMGKTYGDALGEVDRGIESVESAAAMPHLMKGETLEQVARGIDVELVRQPVGVVAAITPFNFPAMIPLWFLPYAIATGNALVLKPSERDPLPAQRMIELLDEIDAVPPGVVNLVHGGRAAVEALLDHAGIDAISFVGQASTARFVACRGIENGKRVQALGGAKNSLVVMPDADLSRTLPAISGSAFGAAGQRCLAGSVCVLVGSEERQDEVRDAIAAAAADLTAGDGADPDTDVCPMVAPEARERAEAAVERAVEEGADLVLDGRVGGGEGGALLRPTILSTTDTGSEIATQELFGPILTLIRVPDLDAALEFVNESRYGNAGTIFTTSGAAARSYRYGVHAGMLGVNIGVPAPVAWFPFAGWKDSCDGDLHANGTDAVDFYTRKKVVTSRWG